MPSVSDAPGISAPAGMPIIVVVIDFTRSLTFQSGSQAIFGSVGRGG